MELVNYIFASVEGNEYTPQPEATRRQRILAQTALNIMRVENPHRAVQLSDMVAAKADDSQVEQALDELNQYIDDPEHHIDKEKFRSLQLGLNSEILGKAGFDDEHIATDFANLLENVTIVAHEKNVTVAEVYRSDELYYEACGRAMSPEKYATEGVAAIDAMTSETLRAALVRNIELMLPKQILETISSEQLDELIMAMQFDSELTAHFEEVMAPRQEAMRQALTYMFLKTYGYEKLLTLAPDILTKLAPQQPWVTDVFAEFLDE